MEPRVRPREDWADDGYVAYWLDHQGERSAERLRQFALVRSLVPREPQEPFRYLNLGAGDGRLDEILLTHFPRATATLVDGSSLMVERACQRLRPFGDRVLALRADLATPDWREAAQAPFDVAVSTIAIHNLRDPTRIRGLYGEVFQVMAEGGFFLNFDYIRPASRDLRPLAQWASRDPEAGYVSLHAGGGGAGGTLEEQLGWLREAGFAPVDCFWKEFQAALFGGFKGQVRVPSRPSS